MSGSFGPWIDHDGHGCPPSLIGKTMEISARLFADTNAGLQAGQIVSAVVVLDEGLASLPDWNWSEAGKLIMCPLRNVPYAVSMILRYRLQKPPTAMETLRQIAANPKQLELTDA